MTTWDGDIASKQALDLNGSAYVSINDHDRYAFGTDDFTFEGWVSQDVFTGTYSRAPFIGQSDGSNHILFAYDPLTSRMIFEINNGSVSKIYSNSWSPSADDWYHVAVSRKDGVFNFYLNGVAHGEDYNFKEVSIPNINSTFDIGHLTGTDYFDGQVDEFRIWNLREVLMIFLHIKPKIY